MSRPPTRKEIEAEWYPEGPAPVTNYIARYLAEAGRPASTEEVVSACIDQYGVSAETVGRYLRAMRCSGVIEYVRRIGDTTRYIRLRGRDDHGYGSATARGTGRAAGGRQRERRGAPRRPPR